jgi:hypothetical protein
MWLHYRAKIFSRVNGFRLTAECPSSEPSQIVSESVDGNVVKLSPLTESGTSTFRTSGGMKRPSLF